MTQQPFSRPGAVDLSRLAPAGSGTARAGSGAAASTAYSVEVDDQNFQQLLESSMTAPVLLVFSSPSQSPESVTLAEDLQTLSTEFEGRFLLGRVDIDAHPQIAQAVQLQSVPMVFLVAQGRPMPLIQQAAPIEDLRQVITQVFQQLTQQGFSGQHKPLAGSGEVDESGEVQLDPRYTPAEDALARGDIAAAVAEYQKLLDANPADAEAAAGISMAKLMQRTEGVDLNEARAAAAARPDDVEAQTLAADLDLLGGHVDDAFRRLIELVRRTTDKERDTVRTHLVSLFGAVGNDDPRVQRARRNLASALF